MPSEAYFEIFLDSANVRLDPGLARGEGKYRPDGPILGGVTSFLANLKVSSVASGK